MSDQEETYEAAITENVATLKSMGVNDDEDYIRKVLRQTSNDMEAAVQILIPDEGNQLHSHESYENLSRTDMEVQETHISQTDSDQDSLTVSYSLDEERFDDVGEDDTPQPEEPPPSYEDSVETEEHQDLPPLREMETSLTEEIEVQKEDDEKDVPIDQMPSADEAQPTYLRNVEFPLTHYYELEGRVHTDQWSIPYKKEESLGVCMLATIEMMREGAGVVEADENCMKFLKRTLPCSFDKLLTHEAVAKWDESILKGIKEMTHILLELISVRLMYRPVPIYLLDLLAMAFNANASFHNRNRARPGNHQSWVSHLGDDGVFAQSPSFTTRKDSKGWLVEFMNVFALYNGMSRIRANILDRENLPTLQELTALFNSFSGCDDYIVPSYFKSEMSECMIFGLKFVEELKDDALKDKEVGCVFDLLKTLKALFRRCNMVEFTGKVDSLRLTTTLRMFQIPHYNAKMNALKEVVRLTEEPFAAARAGVKNPISSDKVKEWLISNKVLSIAFGGNLHQAQYCDKVKSIVEFLGTSLSIDELSTIWDMQVDKNPAQVENIHSILAYAASRFSALHMDHLFQLIQKSWESASSDSYREKLLGLIGKIGKDDRTGKTAPKILELLWNLAHMQQLSREMVELALNSHYSILIDSYHTRDQERRLYIGKCADDIKKCHWVVAAIKQLHCLAKGMFNSRGHKDQQQIAELQKQYDLLRVTSATLTKVHGRNAQQCHEKGEKLSGSYVMDGHYTHEECVDACLQFMSFLLRDGALYLPTKRANEIWDILISNEEACADDRRLAFKWFDSSMGDLEYDTQQQLFNKRVLKINPVLLDVHGYRCIRNFFETINLAERKLRKIQPSQQIVIDNPDLTGLEYLWKAALEVPDKGIANELIASILQISYSALNHKLKKDLASLHRKFIDDCFVRLEKFIELEEENSQESIATCIERLLLLAQRYITTVEESHAYPRQIPPHGASHRGNQIKLLISVDQQQSTFNLECHTNETILSVRRKIATKLGVTPEQVQLGTSEKWLSINHFNKLIHQLGFTAGQVIIVKTITQGIHSNFESIGSSERLQTALKQERILPGVLMSSQKDMYSKLESLCSTQDQRILVAVRNLLALVPINAKVLEGLEIFVHPGLGPGASGEPRPPTDSPKTVLDDLFSMKSVSPTELLYNLEVLSGKLIPPSSTQATDASAQIFRRNFLEAGGLKYIIDIFKNSTFPSNTNTLIIQDCYVVALSLIKFLLCAPPISELSEHDEEKNELEGSKGEISAQEDHAPLLSRQMSKTKSVEDEVARLTIETMSEEDFTLMLTYLMEVCWATAAGQLDLVMSEEKRSGLHIGACSEAEQVSDKDITISCESLELLITCLKLRKNDLTILYKLPKVEEFIMDVLLGCASSHIRFSLVDYMHELCDEVSMYSAILGVVEDEDQPTHAKRPRPSITEIPHYYFLHMLLSSACTSSLWKCSSSDADITSWNRCNEYFEFLVHLLKGLTESQQKFLEIDVLQMIQKEIDWLENISYEDLPSQGTQTLLGGHLKLCTALFTCYGVDKRAFSENLVRKLINEFLFPASILTTEPEIRPSGIINITAKCSSIPARVAAYELLIELSTSCVENYQVISELLVTMHHKRLPENPKEWEFRPLVEGRSECGFVGLKNAGATCYMNSVLQQLYVQPGIKEKILRVEKEEEDTTSVLSDIQMIFGHLMESKLKYFTPDFFWKNFKLEGRHINVLEHQDASEFFSSLTDQVDEALKKKEYSKVFEGRFGGQFLDQIICHGCEHRFEKEQGFTTLQLSVVQSKSLVESLQEFVRGDMLEGDNRYLCGECDEKRDTLKRTCLKTLPPVLVVHLKRFDYDWEANREVKFNNYFEFPWFLDLEPYTAEGIANQEKGLGVTSERMYELTGIIVHQGQASAGHYYAFVKDKSRVIPSPPEQDIITTTIPEDEEMEVLTKPSLSVTSPNKWLKFNDTIVEEFVFTDELLETECFGGSIKTSSSDPLHNTHPETKVRHWNAYMLFYEAVDPPQTVVTQKDENLSPLSVKSENTVEDKLSQLQELVQKGEKRGLFEDNIPSEILRSVNEENISFMRNRDIYCKEYFDFMWRLFSCNNVSALTSTTDKSTSYGQISIELATQFLLHTYFRAYRDLRKLHVLWLNGLKRLLLDCPAACEWFIEFLSGTEGEHYLRPFLLECSSKEVREDFCAIVGYGLQSYCETHEIVDGGPIDKIILCVLQMLDADVVDNWKTCAQYFMLLRSYATHTPGCKHLLTKDTFVKLTKFLLGSASPTDTHTSPRRWSSVQVKEFGGIYGTLALLVRSTDFSAFESESVKSEIQPENPYMIPSRKADLNPPSDGMHETLFIISDAKNRLIRECILTLRDADNFTTDSISGIFCYCCWNNQTFSATVIGDLQTQISSVPASDLKSYFKVLMEVLLIEDSLQEKRIMVTFKGSKFNPEVSVFKTLRESNESKRIYQVIKFLVGLANKCKIGRSFILKQGDQLQDSVSWLKKKLNEYTWSSTPSSAFSNESSSSKIFQRSISAQDTLEEASALLTELEARESKHTQSTKTVSSSNLNNNGQNSNTHFEG